MSAEHNNFQQIAEATGGVVTPANAIDAGAFALAAKFVPKLDSWRGIAAVAVSYASDVVDGKVARATGTSNELGAAVDAVGDKIKTTYAAYHIAKMNLASKPLLAAVALQNVANAGATVYDSLVNDKSKVDVSKAGKYSTFSNSLGIGLQVIGTELEKNDPQRARNARVAGAVVGWGGLAVFGVRATRDYWRQARSN